MSCARACTRQPYTHTLPRVQNTAVARSSTAKLEARVQRRALACRQRTCGALLLFSLCFPSAPCFCACWCCFRSRSPSLWLRRCLSVSLVSLVYVTLCLSVSLSLYVSVTIYLSLSLFVSVSLCLCRSPCHSQSLCHSLCLSLSMCASARARVSLCVCLSL